jgi:hypothetical protein
LVLAVGALGLAVGMALTGSDPPRVPASGGPLFWGSVDSMGSSVRVGRPFTYGHVILFNSGDPVAVLDDVSLWRATPGLRLVAERADLPRRDALHGTLARAPWYPPRGIALHPLAGFPVRAHGYDHGDVRGDRGVNIVLGLTIGHPGRFSFHGLVVRYHVGGHRYETIVYQAMQVCSSEHPLVHDCPAIPLSEVV